MTSDARGPGDYFVDEVDDETAAPPPDSPHMAVVEPDDEPPPPTADDGPDEVLSRAGELLAEMRRSDSPVAVALRSVDTLADLWGEPDRYGETIHAVKSLCKGSVKLLDDAIKGAITKRRAFDRGFKAAAPGEEMLVGRIVLNPRAPVHETAIVPNGWVLSPKGVFKIVQRKEGPAILPVSPNPVVITERLHDIISGDEALELAWLDRGTWRHIVRDRETLKSGRSIVELAGQGFPVDSNTASDMVAWLSAYEAANERAVPESKRSSQLGWQGKDGADGFLLGDQHHVNVMGPGYIGFHGDDAGDAHLASCFHEKGEIADWLTAITPINNYPSVELVLYASLVPPLQLPLAIPSFCVDLSGETSRGKTSALLVAASAWGVPDERDTHSLVRSWNATQVSLERQAALLNGLPMFLDETKQAPRGRDGRSIVPQTVYAVTNGQGKGRGTREGLDRVRYWRTVLITTGEQSVVDHSRDAGTVARVITLWGDPWGGPCELLPDIMDRLRNNYGQAGLLWVDWCVRTLTDERYLKALRAQLDDLEMVWSDRLRREGTAGGASARIARYLAAIDFVGEWATKVLHLPWYFESVVERCWSSIVSGAASIDRPTEALRELYSRAVAEQGSFAGRADERHLPTRYAGRWDADAKWPELMVTSEFLRSTLEDAGYEVAPTLKTWADRGWLRVGEGKNLQVKTRLGGAQARLFAIRRAAIDEIVVGTVGTVGTPEARSDASSHSDV